jgi:hypothetical protein
MELMSGIQFLVNEKGKKTAVVIDLEEHGELWEDIYDNLIASSRKNEPRDSWEKVKQKLKRAGKING